MSQMPSEQGGEMEASPFDGLIAQVDSYISDPSLITPETLNDLKQQLVDLKMAVDGDEREGMEEPSDNPAMSRKIGGY